MLKAVLIALTLFLVGVGTGLANSTCKESDNSGFTVLEILTAKTICHPEKTQSDVFPLATNLRGVLIRSLQTVGTTAKTVTLVITDKHVLGHEIRAMKDSVANNIFHVYIVASYLSRGDLLLEEMERQACLISTGYVTEARERPTFGNAPPKVQRCLLKIAEAKGEMERARWIRWLLQYATDN